MVVGDLTQLTLEKLQVEVPHNLEVVWAMARPRAGPVKQIIAAAFYCPPSSRKKAKLSDHIAITLHIH